MASPQVNLNSTPLEVDTSLDTIICVELLEDIPGGKSLDVTGINEDVLLAGRIIIEETATGVLKPLKRVGGNYDSLSGSHTYKGILYVSVPKAKPLASIMVRGTINEGAATESAGLPSYPNGAKSALSLIRFVENY